MNGEGITDDYLQSQSGPYPQRAAAQTNIRYLVERELPLFDTLAQSQGPTSDIPGPRQP